MRDSVRTAHAALPRRAAGAVARCLGGLGWAGGVVVERSVLVATAKAWQRLRCEVEALGRVCCGALVWRLAGDVVAVLTLGAGAQSHFVLLPMPTGQPGSWQPEMGRDGAKTFELVFSMLPI